MRLLRGRFELVVGIKALAAAIREARRTPEQPAWARDHHHAHRYAHAHAMGIPRRTRRS
ncbi:hypothetical protein [Streptomyces sp. NPDC058475]|uniref:hypothetical protein n=1 Tax=unclassified Streptomyces TaxID=2593676 RepID=UPI00365A6770